MIRGSKGLWLPGQFNITWTSLKLVVDKISKTDSIILDILLHSLFFNYYIHTQKQESKTKSNHFPRPDTLNPQLNEPQAFLPRTEVIFPRFIAPKDTIVKLAGTFVAFDCCPVYSLTYVLTSLFLLFSLLAWSFSWSTQAPSWLSSTWFQL